MKERNCVLASAEDREKRYTEEVVRIVEIFCRKLPKKQAIRIVSRLEAMARRMDSQADAILAHPQIILRYNVEGYDGWALEGHENGNYRCHFIRNGAALLSSFNAGNLLADCFFERTKERPWLRSGGYAEKYREEEFVEWAGGHLKMNDWRLEQLRENETISVTDPKKVRIRYLVKEETAPPPEKKNWIN